MSNFSESHSLGTYKERKGKRKGANLKVWQKIDDIVSEVYIDLCNGMTKSDVLEKLQAALYPSQEGKKIQQRQSYEYLKAAFMRMQYDFQQQADELRADLYSKMMTVYSDAVKAGDRYNALIALDKIMKLTGIAADKPQTAVQINNNKDGITVNFGFINTEENNDTEEYEAVDENKF